MSSYNLNIRGTSNPPYRSFSCLVWLTENSGPYSAAYNVPQPLVPAPPAPYPAVSGTLDSAIPTMISCRHSRLGIYGISLRGEVTALPNAVSIPAGTEYIDPTSFPGLKVCMKVLDLTKNFVYYCDYNDYVTNSATCAGPASTVITPIDNPAFSVTGTGTGTAHFVMPTLPANATGYVLIIRKVSTAIPPVITWGTVGTTGVFTYSSGGLDGNTLSLSDGFTYYFNLLALGDASHTNSDWVQVIYTM